jgi:ABC-type multidrug transport system fused ATPase/permease subunit
VSKLVHRLPYDDPGRPDLRSPVRFLLWTGARQWPTLVLGASCGTVWMASQALVPAAIGRGLDAGVAAHDPGAAGRWSLVVLALALVQAAAGVLRHRVAVDNWLQASFRAMQLLGRHCARTGVAVRRRLPTGEVVSAATNDALYLGGAFDISARLAGAGVSYVLVAVLLLRRSLPLGLLVLVGVPVLVLALGPVMRPLHSRQAEQREVAGRLTALGADTVAGLRVLRGMGGEPAFLARYRDRSARLREAGERVAGPHAALDAAQVLLPGLFLVTLTWLSARLALQSRMTPGDVVAFYGYAFFLVVPIRTAVEAADKMTRALVGARRVVGVLSTSPLVAEPEHPRAAPPAGAELADALSGLALRPGRLVGVASADPDETAAMALRLGRLVDAEGVSWGGVGLHQVTTEAIRRRIVVSEAEPRLFSGRLRDELDPWHSRSDAEVLAAVHAAAAEDVLDALPEGLDTVVEEGGRGFSGGQRQRLTLARALLADAEVLVLVEPTSAVDAHTEIVVAQRLRAARHGGGRNGGDRSNGDASGALRRTTVVTTTSPLLLDHCDEVAYVVAGRVTDTAPHRELLRRNADYRDTVTRGEAT